MEKGLIDLSAHQQLYLNSWHFLVFCAAAILLMRLVAGGWLKRVLLLVLNLYFLFYFVADLYSAAFLLGFLCVTYLVGELQARLAGKLPAWFPVILSVAAWAFLFLVKDPNLLPRANIFHAFPVRIIGISYLIFRCLQYMLDAEAFGRRSFLTLINFAIFFPTLIAGPIERFENFRAFHDDGALTPVEPPWPALHRIANGMIKKFVLADNLMAFGIYDKAPGEVWSVPLLWTGALLQLTLIYLDFSGYCDLMIGVARLMRFKVCENFDRPWLAGNIQEFWGRWHISLSRFIRDYCFTPINLAIARHAPRTWHFPLVTAAYFFTMMLIALWHGTTWGFVCFGLAHSSALVLSQMMKHFVYPRLNAPARAFLLESRTCDLARKTLTYCFVSFTMLLWFFGPTDSWHIVKAMFGA